MPKLTKGEITRKCPACGRMIIIEDGRWTQHTNPTTWDPFSRSFQPCENAGRAALAQQGTET